MLGEFCLYKELKFRSAIEVKLYYLASFSCDAGVIWLHGERPKSFKDWGKVHRKSTVLRECWVSCSVMDSGKGTLWRIMKDLCEGEHSPACISFESEKQLRSCWYEDQWGIRKDIQLNGRCIQSPKQYLF